MRISRLSPRILAALCFLSALLYCVLPEKCFAQQNCVAIGQPIDNARGLRNICNHPITVIVTNPVNGYSDKWVLPAGASTAIGVNIVVKVVSKSNQALSSSKPAQSSKRISGQLMGQVTYSSTNMPWDDMVGQDGNVAYGEQSEGNDLYVKFTNKTKKVLHARLVLTACDGVIFTCGPWGSFNLFPGQNKPIAVPVNSSRAVPNQYGIANPPAYAFVLYYDQVTQ